MPTNRISPQKLLATRGRLRVRTHSPHTAVAVGRRLVLAAAVGSGESVRRPADADDATAARPSRGSSSGIVDGLGQQGNNDARSTHDVLIIMGDDDALTVDVGALDGGHDDPHGVEPTDVNAEPHWLGVVRAAIERDHTSRPLGRCDRPPAGRSSLRSPVRGLVAAPHSLGHNGLSSALLAWRLLLRGRQGVGQRVCDPITRRFAGSYWPRRRWPLPAAKALDVVSGCRSPEPLRSRVRRRCSDVRCIGRSGRASAASISGRRDARYGCRSWQGPY